MRGHLQCRDTLAGNEGYPLKTGTTVHTKLHWNIRMGKERLFTYFPCGPNALKSVFILVYHFAAISA